MIQFILSLVLGLLATLEQAVTKESKTDTAKKGEKQEANNKQAKGYSSNVIDQYDIKPVGSYFAEKRKILSDYKQEIVPSNIDFKVLNEKTKADDAKHAAMKAKTAKDVPVQEYARQVVMKDVKDEKSETSRFELKYNKMMKNLAKPQAAYRKLEPSQGDIMKTWLPNLGQIVKNAWYTGPGIIAAKLENRKTMKHYKENPFSKDPISIHQHGVSQTAGSMYPRMQTAKEKGFRPLAYTVSHSDSREHNVDKIFKKMGEFMKKTNIHDPQFYLEGHSSGADMVTAMASDGWANDYGIVHATAVAPTNYGIPEVRTPAQKVIGMFADISHDVHRINGKPNPKGMRNALNMYEMRPPVIRGGVDVVFGEYDRAVVPELAYSRNAKMHHWLRDSKKPASTAHFGTSGQSIFSDEAITDLMRKSYLHTKDSSTRKFDQHKHEYLYAHR